jgi:hypothetical protein
MSGLGHALHVMIGHVILYLANLSFEQNVVFVQKSKHTCIIYTDLLLNQLTVQWERQVYT